MSDPQFTTISGAPNGLRDAFERAKQAAQEGPGIAFLDPSGVGEPAFAVSSNADWDKWVQNPSAVIDNSSVLTIERSDFAEAAFEQLTDGVRPEQRH